MKQIKYILFALMIAIAAAGCSQLTDFGEINKDPNNPSDANTGHLFVYAARYVPEFAIKNLHLNVKYDDIWQEWSGYMSESGQNQYGPLNTTDDFDLEAYIYLYPLKNLKYIIDLNESEDTKNKTYVSSFGEAANQIAAAKTLMAYYYMMVTDICGPAVVSEAFKGSSDDNWYPKYDTQKEIYAYLDESLSAAYKQFDESGSLSDSDILYGGDITKWKKFNASLRMLLAIKLSDVDPNTGKTRFAAAYADGGMASAEDGLTFTYDGLFMNPLYQCVSPDYSASDGNFVPNYFIVNAMKERKDPRMFKYFQIEGYKGARDAAKFPADSYDSYYGVPFGLSVKPESTDWPSVCCSFNASMYAIDATITVIPAARILFTEAEAAFRGWISADAKALYEEAIKVSFDQWGASGAEEYIASEKVAYNAADGLELIATQRWIAGFLGNGVEAWSDWRRLDIPKMPVGPEAAATGNMHYPFRLMLNKSYDSIYNPDNYAEALKDLSPAKDVVTSRVWWDVADNDDGVLTEEEVTPPTI